MSFAVSPANGFGRSVFIGIFACFFVCVCLYVLHASVCGLALLPSFRQTFSEKLKSSKGFKQTKSPYSVHNTQTHTWERARTFSLRIGCVFQWKKKNRTITTKTFPSMQIVEPAHCLSDRLRCVRQQLVEG